MAKKYIDADKLMKSMYHRAFETDGDTMWQSGCWVRYRAIEQTVKEQPTADVRENVRGEWRDCDGNPVELNLGSPTRSCWCSKCGAWLTASDEYYVIGKFCPNCGADMRGEKDG